VLKVAQGAQLERIPVALQTVTMAAQAALAPMELGSMAALVALA